MRVYILFVGNIRTCFHALAAGSITIMSECTHVLDVSIESRPLYSEATPPPTIVSSVLTTRSWPIRKKRIGTSSLVSDTRHSSEPTFGRRDSLVGCIHLAMTQRYPFCMEETWKRVAVHWQQGQYQLWVICESAFMWIMKVCPLVEEIRPGQNLGPFGDQVVTELWPGQSVPNHRKTM